MDTTAKNIPVTFYENLGKLFYAMAAADKVVRKTEVDALKKLVTKEWVPIKQDTDEFGSDTAFQIESVFDWLDNEGTKAQEAFQDFKDYYVTHQEFFSTAIKTKIRQTCDAIAASFSGKNKSELAMLANLHLLFQQ
ncbi:hypothetical protein [Aquimarina brevivitae]|uniref:Co-chaperone DjlA N-terminal domain-containing protein n=1 Tax=Aquimarina brevivitae TaxID=323412 RepID=A0A4Q7PL42_9FLAO|nr:hypothetical protein [Aquimarina brevivitae]RZS99682.1 hypothetical protein EV197_0905 [Aquimarina brevivitae]